MMMDNQLMSEDAVIVDVGGIDLNDGNVKTAYVRIRLRIIGNLPWPREQKTLSLCSPSIR